MARVTLQTIADRLGVSRMTVSNAFSRPTQLSAELRGRILAAAQELGYAGPDPAARALVRGSSGAVGVLLTDSVPYAFTDDVATRFLGAVAEELASTGLALTLLTSSTDGDIVPARDVAMDGAIVYSCRTDSAARDWLMRRKLPLVFVDQDPVPGIPSVNVDDRGGAFTAARHVVELGHRRVGLVTIAMDGPLGIVDPAIAGAAQGHPQHQRMLGWLDALGAAGIEPVVAQIGHNGAGEAHEAADLLLGRESRPTAILAFSDVVALGVIRAAAEHGLRVPEDLSVIGFDDSPVAQVNPNLTTVRQDVAEKGRQAAAELRAGIERARTGHSGRARHVMLPTELVVRHSTAPPPLVPR